MNRQSFKLLAVLVAATAVLGVVGYLAGQISGALAPLVVLGVGIWMLRRWHARGRFVSEEDDLAFRDLCRSDVFSSGRRLYRALPTDPRCRFCLVPFGGVGRVLGIVPSRKNPNFCPR